MCNKRFGITLPNHPFDFSKVTSSCFAEEVVSDNVLSMLSSSACCLVYGMVPFLNAILGTMLPMLCMAKQDNMKWVFSSGKNLPNVHFWEFDSWKLLKPDLQLLHSKHVQLWKSFASTWLSHSYSPNNPFSSALPLSLQLCVTSVTVSWSISPTWTRLQIPQSEKIHSPVKSMLLLTSSSVTGYKAGRLRWGPTTAAQTSLREAASVGGLW